MDNIISTKIFGMISYIPDKEPDRSMRIDRIQRCFTNIQDIFGKDVEWLIIAQNWNDFKIPNEMVSKCRIYEFEKLGILGARKKLREKFLELNYDWLIMLDDDCIVEPLIENAGKEYFKTLDEHPGGFMFLYDEKIQDYAEAQLNLCAISREIYLKEPMIDIDAQNGVGYEDFIYSHLLHYKYPDAEFRFDGVKCTQFRNSEEKAPSTWAHEQYGNLRRMDYNSKAVVQFFARGEFNVVNILKDLGSNGENVEFPIDFVFPYVNNQDPIWREKYIKFCNQIGKPELIQRINTERYADMGWLVYLFRGIDKFLPFVRNVYMIVERYSQIPKWLDTKKVKVIFHRDIIPQKYLPTYNSTTIEMFLDKIPGLSEHFIYANDDMYPLAPMRSTDFFTLSGRPRETFKIYKIDIKNDSMFTKVCTRCFREVAEKLNIPIAPGISVKPDHGFSAQKLSTCKNVISKMGNYVYDNITPFRTDKNHNQYIYLYYSFLKNEPVCSSREFAYVNMENKIDEIANTIFSGNFNILCINDNDTTDRELWAKEGYKVKEAFETIFPEKSKFEL